MTVLYNQVRDLVEPCAQDIASPGANSFEDFFLSDPQATFLDRYSDKHPLMGRKMKHRDLNLPKVSGKTRFQIHIYLHFSKILHSN
jgi:hypothetical protein